MSSRTSQRLNPSHYIPAGVARMERSEIRDGNGGGYPDNTISPSALTDPDCAEPVIGRRFAPTRWLHPGYSRYCKVLAAALARMRRYRTHHPHRSCGWLRQAKAAESLIARRMGGANGSRECAPDDKLRDTHQLQLVGRWVSQRAQPMLGDSRIKTLSSFPDVQVHIGDAPLSAGPESILPVVVMDSGLALRAPRNDGDRGCEVEPTASKSPPDSSRKSDPLGHYIDHLVIDLHLGGSLRVVPAVPQRHRMLLRPTA